MGGAGSHAIGLDVGGTKTAGGIVDLGSGALLAREAFPTRPERGGEAVLSDALGLAARLMEQAGQSGWTIAGIGVSVCELVDLAGNVTSGHTVRWQGQPVQQTFGRLAPARVESDVRAHALAEAVWGAGRGHQLFVFASVGTGISSCLVLGGQPYAGARGNALVLATSRLTVPAAPDAMVEALALEEFSSGPALVARYNARAAQPAACAEDVLAAAEAGEGLAREVVASAGEALGASLGWLVNVLDPEVMVIGGGLGLAGGLYWSSLEAAVRRHVWAEDSRRLPVIPARLGPDAALAGAALAAARRASHAGASSPL